MSHQMRQCIRNLKVVPLECLLHCLQRTVQRLQSQPGITALEDVRCADSKAML